MYHDIKTVPVGVKVCRFASVPCKPENASSDSSNVVPLSRM